MPRSSPRPDRAAAQCVGATRRSNPLWTGAWLHMMMISCFAWMAACQSSDPAASDQDQIMAAVETRNQERLDDLQRRYLIGPVQAQMLGYRIDWQTRIAESRISGVRQLTVQGDSVFVLDDRNFLARFRRVDGNRLWRIAVGSATLEIQGIAYAPLHNRVYLAAGGDLLVHDATTGGQLAREGLEKLASTPPIALGDFLLYGSRNGQLVWYNHPLGFQWKSYQVASSLDIEPVVTRSGHLVAVGPTGELMVLTAVDGQLLWSWPILGRITARPAIGRGVVYVASNNQTLYAFDLGNGKKLWESLTASRLTNPPTYIDGRTSQEDRVYMQIPAEGIACYEALPANSRLGVRAWTAEDVRGNVVGKRGSNLMVWDGESQTMTLLDSRSGSVVDTARMPGAARLVITAAHDAEMFAAGLDGRLIRLVPE